VAQSRWEGTTSHQGQAEENSGSDNPGGGIGRRSMVTMKPGFRTLPRPTPLIFRKSDSDGVGDDGALRRL
jgi:hypothetical protein